LVEGTAEKEKFDLSATLFGFPDYELDKMMAQNLTASVSGPATFEGTNGLRDFEQGVTPLPGTLVEINNIARILDGGQWNYQKLLNQDATEENFKSLKGSAVVHIATHGFFLEDFNVAAVSAGSEGSVAGIQSKYARFNPLFRSGLLLAGASKTMQNQRIDREEDGVLTAYEVMNLNMDQTEVVVMSACETGLGEVRNGEGVYGLQRAFMVAGAKAIVMSLWKVNDETTQRLMTNFYSEWFGGATKYDAFRKAILDIKTEFPEPFYWGPFVMLGK